MISIHTPAKGVTRPLHPKMDQEQDFNPHSREGSDNLSRFSYSIDRDFNPHSREGSDRRGFLLSCIPADFNPHSREGSDSWISILTKNT